MIDQNGSMLYVKQIKYPENQLVFCPNFNLDLFPAIFMHGDDCAEVVDIKDKGWVGQVHQIST
jgi:hypothetical protein